MTDMIVFGIPHFRARIVAAFLRSRTFPFLAL